MSTCDSRENPYEPFLPAWWCRRGHAQTIWAAVGRPPAVLTGLSRQRWETADGDFVDLDFMPAAQGQPALLVLHGLESSSRAPQVRGLLQAASRQGWRALALNFRSCSGEANRLRCSYHAGYTADVEWVIRRLADSACGAPVCCVGVSLGGNVLLKYLGEQGDSAPLAAAATISAPFDLAASARAFEQGWRNRVYMRRLLGRLKRKTLAKLARYPDLVDRRRLEAVRTLREFDAAVTAPLNGFASAQDYWTASSCRQFLDRIRRPTLLINAQDDPLVPAEGLPREAAVRNAWLTAAFPARGGHAGFITGKRPSRAACWAEQAVIDFFARAIALSSKVCKLPQRTILPERV